MLCQNGTYMMLCNGMYRGFLCYLIWTYILYGIFMAHIYICMCMYIYIWYVPQVCAWDWFIWYLYGFCIEIMCDLYELCIGFAVGGIYMWFAWILYCILLSIVEPSHCLVWIPDVGYLTKSNTHKTAELQQYLVITSANTIIVCHNMF
jgi:hypothetical protein